MNGLTIPQQKQQQQQQKTSEESLAVTGRVKGESQNEESLLNSQEICVEFLVKITNEKPVSLFTQREIL